MAITGQVKKAFERLLLPKDLTYNALVTNGPVATSVLERLLGKDVTYDELLQMGTRLCRELQMETRLCRELIPMGTSLCRERIIRMNEKVIRRVKLIYDYGMKYCMGPNDSNPLINASHQGLVDMVWGFIECAKQTNTNLHTDESGKFQEFLWLCNKLNETALDVAIKEGHVEVAKLLLENASLECLISKRNHEGKLPVSMLADHEHDMFIWSTLEKATTTSAVDPPASTLIWIGEENSKQDTEVYIVSIMDPKSYPRSHKHELRDSLEKLDQGTLELTPNKNTILHLVSQIGDIEYAHDILVKHPSLVKHRNSEGETAAYVAAREGHVDILAIIISYLKTKNDNIESFLVRSKDKDTALHIAVQNHHVGVVFWLIKEIPQLVNLINDCNESPIYLAAERGYYHTLKNMLNEGETRTFDGPRGKTALHAAAISGSKECIRYLLDEEIDQHKRDEQDYTPLQYAVNHNNKSAISELVDADPSIVYEIIKEDGINTSVVHIAASRGYCETLKFLMSQCPECSKLLDEKGKNIFHIAVENMQAEVIEFISGDKSYTSLVNQKDKEGNTPVHLLMASDLEMMEVAIDYRVNINTMNNEKLTPLDMASSSEKRKKLLERVAVSSHVQDKRSPSIKISPWNEKRTEEEFQLVDNLLIVATLIATASFAAAFAVPGGFDGNEGSKQGMPILLRKTAFKVFMLANNAAFASSCSVLGSHILLLVYRLKADEVDEENRKSIHARIMGMYYLTGWSLLCMIVAFLTGIYAVLSPIRGLAIYLCSVPLWVPFNTIFFSTIIGSSTNAFIDLLWSFASERSNGKK
ncbi:ankyrin repeat-containing protein [Artemisia annua]|uniref:Ankyrin repeat-containing protein n=1 Tax=Artemisia annua TaxID=35608 RepID=A0A2U1MWX3_ARTAN|nr:ankyrin repeat-containing protein [Artemisia annua]